MQKLFHFIFAIFFLLLCSCTQKTVKEFDITIYTKNKFTKNNSKLPIELIRLIKVYDSYDTAYVPNIKVVRRDIKTNNQINIEIPLSSGNDLRKLLNVYTYADYKVDFSVENIEKIIPSNLLFQISNVKPSALNLSGFSKTIYYSVDTTCKVKNQITTLNQLVNNIEITDKQIFSNIAIVFDETILDTLRVVDVTNSNSFQNVVDGSNSFEVKFKCNDIANIKWSVLDSENVKIDVKYGKHVLISRKFSLKDPKKEGYVKFCIKPENNCYISKFYSYTVYVKKKPPLPPDCNKLTKPNLDLSGFICRWNKASNAHHYKVEVRKGSEIRKVDDIFDLSYDLRKAYFFNDLICNTDYNVSVIAVCSNNQQVSNTQVLNIPCNCDDISLSVLPKQQEDKFWIFICSPVKNYFKYFVEFNGVSYPLSSNIFGGNNNYEIIQKLLTGDKNVVIKMRFRLECVDKKYYSKTYNISLGCWQHEGSTKCGIVSYN